MRALLVLLASTALGACVATTLETSSHHPANPSAHPAPAPRSAEALKPGFDPFEAYGNDTAGPEPAGAHDHHGGHGAGSVAPTSSGAEANTAPDHDAHATPAGQSPGQNPSREAPSFTCPMHAEVVRAGPGSCPICGMKLVPKKPEAPPHSH